MGESYPYAEIQSVYSAAPANWDKLSYKIYKAKLKYIKHFTHTERERTDNKVIQAEGKIYWETKSTLYSFSSNEPSLGLWGMMLVMLNQQWMFNIYIYIYIYILYKKSITLSNIDKFWKYETRKQCTLN